MLPAIRDRRITAVIRSQPLPANARSALLGRRTLVTPLRVFRVGAHNPFMSVSAAQADTFVMEVIKRGAVWAIRRLSRYSCAPQRKCKPS
jgi:hypothetical protein